MRSVGRQGLSNPFAVQLLIVRIDAPRRFASVCLVFTAGNSSISHRDVSLRIVVFVELFCADRGEDENDGQLPSRRSNLWR